MNYPTSTDFREPSTDESLVRLLSTGASIWRTQPVNQVTENQFLVCNLSRLDCSLSRLTRGFVMESIGQRDNEGQSQLMPLGMNEPENELKNETENRISSKAATHASTVERPKKESPKNRLPQATRNAKPVDETLISGAIAGVVRAAQRQGQTIEELQAEMLADHQMLAWEERRLLSEIVTEAWQRMAIAFPDHD